MTVRGAKADGAPGNTKRPWGGLLRTRNYGLLWLGETTSGFGSAITTVALPLVAVVSLHASTATVAMLTALVWLPWLLIGLPAGAWIDRWPLRRTLLTADAVSTAVLITVPVAAWTHVLTVDMLLAAALLAGCSGVFFSLAFSVYLPSLVAKTDLLEGNSKLQTSSAAAQFAGPGLGGVLAQVAGAVTGVFVDALTFLVSASCLLGIRKKPEADPATRSEEARDSGSEERRGILRQIWQGFAFIHRDPYFLPLAYVFALINFMWMGAEALEVVYLVRTIGVSQGTAGVLLGVGSFGGVIGAAIAPTVARRIGTARTLLLGDVAGAPFGLLLPLAGHGWRLSLFVVGNFIVVASFSMANVVTGTFRMAYCPPELFGRVGASLRFLIFGANALGAAFGGALASALGTRDALWVLQTTFAVVPLILLATPVGKVRDLPVREDAEESPNPESGPKEILPTSAEASGVTP